MAKDTNYVSEMTKFLNTYREAHPKVIYNQKQLRKTWWDRDTTGIDQAESENENSDVKLDGYAYFSYPTSAHPTQK